MALRATWKGFLKLSLVSCPVRLYTATSSSSRITFNQLHKDTKNRVQMKYHDPELGQVERSDLVKGYEYDKNQYVIIDSEDLEKVKIESNKTIDIEMFVDNDEIDPIYVDSPYYLAPDGAMAEETFAVLKEAMRNAGKSGVARVVLSSRERVVTLSPLDKGMIVNTLRNPKEVRRPDAYFEDISDGDVDNNMLDLATNLIRQNTGTFEPDAFTDRYEEALQELIKAKIAGNEPVFAAEPDRGNVVNLMDALKQSLEGGKPAAKRATKKVAKKPAAKKKSG